MRYSDQPGVSCEIHVEADPTSVWALVIDIHLPPRLSPELDRVEWLGGADRPVVGAAFVGHNSHPRIGQWRTVSYITDLHEPRVFGWVVTDPEGRFAGTEGAADRSRPAATWRYELEPEATGTLLRQSVRIGPGRSGLSPIIDGAPEREGQFVAARLDELRRNIGTTLGDIKTLAEAAR
ncbi:SRPBCC family protein [Micromonospora sp. SH-82]|uniref:SRPBCC family protein n=1 Tax=Micromonospora sp. SH-82 TaxID=3132938 RepID=UPI003EC02E76